VNNAKLVSVVNHLRLGNISNGIVTKNEGKTKKVNLSGGAGLR
jgi:hypothetical protein